MLRRLGIINRRSSLYLNFASRGSRYLAVGRNRALAGNLFPFYRFSRVARTRYCCGKLNFFANLRFRCTSYFYLGYSCLNRVALFALIVRTPIVRFGNFGRVATVDFAFALVICIVYFRIIIAMRVGAAVVGFSTACKRANAYGNRTCAKNC